MGFWQEVGAGLKEGMLAAIDIQRGKNLVQQWANYKPQRAHTQIETVVDAAFREGNRTLLIAILNEFGEQIKCTELQETQDDLNHLLWYFKVSVSQQIEASSDAAAASQ